MSTTLIEENATAGVTNPTKGKVVDPTNVITGIMSQKDTMIAEIVLKIIIAKMTTGETYITTTDKTNAKADTTIIDMMIEIIMRGLATVTATTIDMITADKTKTVGTTDLAQNTTMLTTDTINGRDLMIIGLTMTEGTTTGERHTDKLTTGETMIDDMTTGVMTIGEITIVKKTAGVKSTDEMMKGEMTIGVIMTDKMTTAETMIDEMKRDEIKKDVRMTG